MVFLQVEHVIKEQNMLDVFVMIESYCNLLIERVNLIEQERLVTFPFLLLKTLCFFSFSLAIFLPLVFDGHASVCFV